MPNPIWEPVNLKLGCYYLLVGLSLQYCCKATRPSGMPSADLIALLLGSASSILLSQLRSASAPCISTLYPVCSQMENKPSITPRLPLPFANTPKH